MQQLLKPAKCTHNAKPLSVTTYQLKLTVYQLQETALFVILLTKIII